MLPAGWRRRYRGLLEREAPLAPRTTWRIGGPADLYLEPASVDELAATLGALRAVGMPYRLLGGGSNLLVADSGVRGAVVSLERLASLHRMGDAIVAEAGARLASVVRFAVEGGLAGAEKLAGIPGRVGGAVFGNAGGRHGDIGSLVARLTLLAPDGRLERFAPPKGFFAYRQSQVGDRVVVDASLRLAPDGAAAVRERTRRIVEERRRTQPGWVGNAGCVFKNPPGDSAGRLIDAAGCKGMGVGRVHVSTLHANFFENGGGGSCDDVLRLIERVQGRVRAVHAVDLEVEVRQWL